jgi:hypothetical protein
MRRASAATNMPSPAAAANSVCANEGNETMHEAVSTVDYRLARRLAGRARILPELRGNVTE